MVKFSLVSVSVIMLFLHECNCARIPLQVDITKMAQCDDSKRAGNGDKVTVHYWGFLMNGTKFDSSFDRRKPFTFELGVGQVIPGWDEGLQGVCKGDELHLVVPSHLAYGERGARDVIPPGATLQFDVVIVDVEHDLDMKMIEEIKRRSKENQGPGDQEANIYTSQIIGVILSSAVVVVMLFLLCTCCNSTWYGGDLSNDKQGENDPNLQLKCGIERRNEELGSPCR